MIYLVEQTNRFNCGSACLAMVLHRTVEEVEMLCLTRSVGELLDPAPADPKTPQIGVCTEEMEAVLWDAGVRYLRVNLPASDEDSWYSRTYDGMRVLHGFDRIAGHLNHGRVAILAVDSLRNPDGGHWIVAAGRTLLDPVVGPGPRYRHLSDHEQGTPLGIHTALLIDRQA